MADQTQHDDPKRPSQAEGDRATVEESLGERDRAGQRGTQGAASGQRNRTSPGDHDRTDDPNRPSKPEGERTAAQE